MIVCNRLLSFHRGNVLRPKLSQEVNLYDIHIIHTISYKLTISELSIERGPFIPVPASPNKRGSTVNVNLEKP